MHFFFPPLVMRLVEVVKGEATSTETLETAATLAKRMGRDPVMLHKELPGFLVNRILRSIVNEAYYLLENGVASFEDIDKACRSGLNHPLGPFQLSDFSGLDIGYNARQELAERTGRPEDAPPPSLARRVERGDLGRKTGRGFYDYSDRPADRDGGLRRGRRLRITARTPTPDNREDADSGYPRGRGPGSEHLSNPRPSDTRHALEHPGRC